MAVGEPRPLRVTAGVSRNEVFFWIDSGATVPCGDVGVVIVVVAGVGLFTADSNGIRRRAATGIGVPPAASVRSVVTTGSDFIGRVHGVHGRSSSSLQRALSFPQASGVGTRSPTGLMARDGDVYPLVSMLSLRTTGAGLTARDLGLSGRTTGVGLDDRATDEEGLKARVGGGLATRLAVTGSEGTGFRATGAGIIERGPGGGLSARPGPGLMGRGPVMIARCILARSTSIGLLARSMALLVRTIISGLTARSISTGVRARSIRIGLIARSGSPRFAWARISGVLGRGYRGPMGRRSTLRWRDVDAVPASLSMGRVVETVAASLSISRGFVGDDGRLKAEDKGGTDTKSGCGE